MLPTFSLDALEPTLSTEFTMRKRGHVGYGAAGVRAGRSVWKRIGWRKLATVTAAGLAVSMGYHVVFGQNGLTAYQHKRQDSRELEMQSRSLSRENELLKGHITRLESDPDAIEHQAREELHYTRPGEVIYTLPAAPAAE
jgi:cell division protein FtsB